MNSGLVVDFFVLHCLLCGINNALRCKLKKVKNSKITDEKIYSSSSESLYDEFLPDVDKENIKDLPLDPNRILPVFHSELSGIYENAATGPNNETIYFGDQILTEEQFQDLFSEDQEFALAIQPQSYRWPDGKIFYHIDESTLHIQDLIQKAMMKWSSSTCVNFYPVENRDLPYIHITRTNKGCFSHTGRIKPGQTLSLGPRCEQDRTISHELGHVLGLFHEHVRPDRDDYVFVFMNNINETKRRNFRKRHNVTYARTPYDFGSTMHYDFFAFSSNRKYAMVSKDPLAKAVMYNSVKPSFNDYKAINNIYNCSDLCEHSEKNCLNGGFLTSDGGGSCVCVCPDHYQGEFCETEKELPNCGGKLTAEGNISSPNPYPLKWTCVYWIQAPLDHIVEIEFYRFHLMTDCNEEYMHFRRTDIFSDDPGEKFCGNILHGKRLKSEGTDMVIVLKTGTNVTSQFESSFIFSKS